MTEPPEWDDAEDHDAQHPDPVDSCADCRERAAFRVLVEQEEAQTAGRTIAVSPRQIQVVHELARDGAKNDVIGARLGISPVTVGNHMWAVMKAAGTPTRTALALAVDRGELLLRPVDRPTPENRA
jgi:DNA-binding NarL/FixJ family response regulator